jgi:ribonuclease HIII
MKQMVGEPRRKISTHTVKLDTVQMGSLRRLCIGKGFEGYAVPYATFAFRGNGINIVAYESGKVVVQGRGTEDFVHFELEPKVTFAAALGYDDVTHPEWFEEHAGLDESGKGDLFGPLVTACVIAGGAVVRRWMEEGVRDSKSIAGDAAIFALESKILKSDCATATMCVGMEKYNELYGKFGRNMNVLLGWMHSRSLKNALEKRQAERRRFPRSRLGTAHQVTTDEDDGDRLRLDRRRRFIALIGNGVEEFGREAEFVKTHRFCP